MRGIFFGEPKPAFAHVHDAATPFARLPYVVLVAILLVIGCYPRPILQLIDVSSRPLIERILPSAAGGKLAKAI